MQPQALGEQNPRRTRVHAWVKARARPGGPVSFHGRGRPPVGRPRGSDAGGVAPAVGVLRDGLALVVGLAAAAAAGESRLQRATGRACPAGGR